MLYCEADAKAARPKASAAAERLQQINSSVQCQVIASDLTAKNIDEVLADITLIVDGTDNFSTRYLLNDYAVSHQVPFIYAGVVGTYGMVGTIVPGNGPCLRCTYPDPPPAAHAPTCRSAGVLGPAVAVIAGLASAEAIKVMVGGDSRYGFHYLDVWTNQSNFLSAIKDPDCPCCGHADFAWLEGRLGGKDPEVLCGGNTVQIPPMDSPPDLPALAKKLLGAVHELQCSEHFLRFQSRGLDVILFADGRALVRGSEDPSEARSLLAETVGS
jgi:adenylyltransferase/sulfurtransferase